MGDRLIVTIVPEEQLAIGGLCIRDEHGHEVALFGRDARRPMWEEVQKLHPEAYFKLKIPIGDVWSLPEEPHRHEWFRVPERLAEHSETVRRELECFINKRLHDLCGAIRSGWWILGAAKVHVVDCNPVPEVPRGRP